MILNIVQINSVIAKNHEKIMHLTETFIGFILGSEAPCTELNLALQYKLIQVVKKKLKEAQFKETLTEDRTSCLKSVKIRSMNR